MGFHVTGPLRRACGISRVTATSASASSTLARCAPRHAQAVVHTTAEGQHRRRPLPGDVQTIVVAENTGGRTRYRLLETVRQYALEKVGASGEADAVPPRLTQPSS
ncbi:hypothetical protein B1T45_19430 [Mycobacterium kansasii]|uniref:Uncharacterized protein n=1 Tax=Mycobacterium kansasii TaxID=1768 RepID=A0A7G1I704_MYCKA|nr:hypothetical protein B1T43_19020 [Mycobacterium kansasii]ARG63110.1 hypothetical protein B1T45_19430 [Mycobacterium kansasii]ARG70788.1 hypothetical protein B1T47_19030 [Mycobacterium kansasii]ARG74701.1 hypothetical protein B1T51_09700 [Mycobacterium kansasii]ARG80157.1 hypothetical protein B1T52_09755 [Mycobacterium kansasii]